MSRMLWMTSGPHDVVGVLFVECPVCDGWSETGCFCVGGERLRFDAMEIVCSRCDALITVDVEWPPPLTVEGPS